MAASSATLLITSRVHSDRYDPLSNKLRLSGGYQSRLAFCPNSKQLNCRRYTSVQAEYSDGSGAGGGDFLAGFVLGGAVFGTLAYVFAPQIRRSLLNEDESGFRRAKRPIYYHDEGLEKARQMLNAKINQLNSAIDNVSSRLRGGNNVVTEPVEAEAEGEAEAST